MRRNVHQWGPCFFPGFGVLRGPLRTTRPGRPADMPVWWSTCPLPWRPISPRGGGRRARRRRRRRRRRHRHRPPPRGGGGGRRLRAAGLPPSSSPSLPPLWSASCVSFLDTAAAAAAATAPPPPPPRRRRRPCPRPRSRRRRPPLRGGGGVVAPGLRGSRPSISPFLPPMWSASRVFLPPAAAAAVGPGPRGRRCRPAHRHRPRAFPTPARSPCPLRTAARCCERAAGGRVWLILAGGAWRSSGRAAAGRSLDALDGFFSGGCVVFRAMGPSAGVTSSLGGCCGGGARVRFERRDFVDVPVCTCYVFWGAVSFCTRCLRQPHVRYGNEQLGFALRPIRSPLSDCAP